jgi:ribulose kinase
MAVTEKARSRVQHYFDLTDHMTWEQAKECAISECKEIIRWLNDVSYLEIGSTDIDYGQSKLNEMVSEINNM